MLTGYFQMLQQDNAISMFFVHCLIEPMYFRVEKQ